uniref:Uncharacterized protein n=1 Tax=Biomphalaria glabrata TaxID=6526 RepID=A0A2C9KNW9_BIOGL
MSSKISTMALIGFLVLVIATFGSVSGLEPSLLDVTAIVCPAEKPYICLPYGVCCGGDQFCFQGSCESCFPADVSEESFLLKWCQEKGLQDVSVMRHHSCALACYARFNSSVLQTHKDKEEDTYFTDRTIIIAATASVIFIQFVVIVILIKCLVSPRRRVEENRAREESTKTVEASNQINEMMEQPTDVDTPMDRMRAIRQLSHPESIEETIPLTDITINP